MCPLEYEECPPAKYEESLPELKYEETSSVPEVSPPEWFKFYPSPKCEEDFVFAKCEEEFPMDSEEKDSAQIKKLPRAPCTF